MTKLINKSLGAATAAAKMAIGALSYAKSRSTPAYAYQSMIRLFTLTGGRSNDIISSWIAKLNPPYALPSTSGVLGNLTPPDSTRIASGLRERGFHVFDQRLRLKPAAHYSILPSFSLVRRGKRMISQTCARRRSFMTVRIPPASFTILRLRT